VQEPEQKRSRKSSKVSEDAVPVVPDEAEEVNYLDEKEKKAEMLMEADKENDAKGEKGSKEPLKDDKYFSEVKFTDLNLSE